MPPRSSSAGEGLSSTLVASMPAPETQAKSADGVWSGSEQSRIASVQQPRADLRSYRSVALDQNALGTILHAAPMEFSQAAAEKRLILTLPYPNGTFARFSIAESPIMAPELAARFPEIKTYTGSGLDDPTAITRFDWTPLGFHAIILSEKETVLIEPSGVSDVENYIVYSQNDVVSGSLRTYRLAVAATAEYTQTYGGGTVGGALSAITTTINLVDAIYEREVAIRLTLIAGETSIIFTNTATDGYTSDDASAMIDENQTTLDAVIGSANYDVGHVFDGRTQSGGGFSWQGLADIGSVCITGRKAHGVDIFRSIQPGVLYAYYSAAHELGHQFGATHTFNATTGLCSGGRTASTAYEPSSGSTIMAYRLACSPDDLKLNGHLFSQQQY